MKKLRKRNEGDHDNHYYIEQKIFKFEKLQQLNEVKSSLGFVSEPHIPSKRITLFWLKSSCR